MEVNVMELPNGLRVIHKFIPYTRTVHCGYVINSGSRDDREGESGMAHFIEHMVFKGTRSRNNFDILNYLDSLGGDLDAYTTKEKTSIYASLCSEHFERATDLLTDITFHATFPESEIPKEKEVIREEIDMYRDAADEAIFEDFDEQIFPSHALGLPILGTKTSVKSLTRDRLKAHLRSHFTQGNVVYSIVGNVSTEEVQRVVDRYLRPLELPVGQARRQAPPPFSEPYREVPASTQQAHQISGGRAFGIHSSLNHAFFLLNNYLGGPAMNSRLNLHIREKYGLSYSIHSFFTSYVDSGMWGVYFGCEPKNVNRIHDLVEKELKDLRDHSLGVIQVAQAKRQCIGQLTLGYENLLTQMLGMAKDLLDYDRIIPFNEYIELIDKITAQEILEAANQAFDPGGLAHIVYKKAS